MSARPVQLVNFARQVPYREALEVQRKCQAKLIELRKFGKPEPGVMFMLEHPAIYTLGRGSKDEFLLDKTVDVIRVERGGEVTYHGPGQLVGYLVLDMEFFKKDLHWMVRNVEEAIMRTTASYDVAAERIKGRTGVWVGNSKVAAIGLGAKQWVTIHGFALNVSSEVLPGFRRIVPCGINAESGQVTCLSDLVGFQHRGKLLDQDVRGRVITAFKDVFDMDIAVDHSSWLKDMLPLANIQQ